MSVGAAEILGRIFEVDPARRITLSELRQAIEELEPLVRERARDREERRRSGRRGFAR